MSRFVFYYTTTASYSVEIEADTEEEAEDKAMEVAAPSLCAQCSGWGRDIGIDLGDWDVDEVEEVR